MSNIYTGTFSEEDWYQVFLNGEKFDHVPSTKVINHSPDGFAFGYGGSGPAQLALAILLEESDEETAEKHYQKFTSVIATFDKKGWSLSSADVKSWLYVDKVMPDED